MRQRLLELLRVPERPDPPPGAGDDLETFRATKGFFYYTVFLWVPKQIAAISGLIFSLAFIGTIERWGFQQVPDENVRNVLQRLAAGELGPGWLGLDLPAILLFFEALAIVTFLIQFTFTGLLLRASWELRWYIVGERALRIRHGLWTVREQTMTIANIQNMTVRQGPLQRLFGFSDLEISTAGGGGGSSSGEEGTEQKDSFHIGRFRGLADASGLRDRLRRRLQTAESGAPSLESRRSKHGEAHDSSSTTVASDLDLASAARELLAEARALRQATL